MLFQRKVGKMPQRKMTAGKNRVGKKRLKNFVPMERNFSSELIMRTIFHLLTNQELFKRKRIGSDQNNVTETAFLMAQ